jgi:hypothetical protein
MDALQQIAAQVNAQAVDIRGEVMLARLLNDGLSESSTLIRQQGQSMRPVRPDVDGARLEQTAAGNRLMSWQLNRDSIYDTLPEGVFHPSSGTHKKISAQEMTAVYRRHRQEEQEARLFFAPLEQEFFLQKAFAERQLQQEMTGIQHAMLDDELLQRLGIDASLPLFFKTALVRLLCYAPLIAGNIPLMEEVFALLLETPVSIKQQLKRGAVNHPPEQLKGMALGESFILGRHSREWQYQYRITIGPVEASQLLHFLAGNPGDRCVQALINFFVPVTWQTDVRTTAVGAGFDTGRLGYNTILCKQVKNG